ncbi:gliding motility-associated C-terminal domain-containing protein [Cellulophaga sp. Z1A5H]|uniref:T9SS type B sorting domain-containing protein n=1 Tax=Cellulophaga sp. Z1A5H TaxID=2687291 RepID=UPI0013FE27D5|nr:gliding motility-associated C-terminal domain-containing protein [Cellulophaga sp. Z1A5H]
MKKALKTFLLPIAALLFFSINSNAQINSNRYTVNLTPENLATCGGVNNSLEEVFIRGNNPTCHDFSITFDLPPGVEYVAGTASITSQTDSFGNPITSATKIYTIGEGGTPSDPIFTILRDSDATWDNGDEVTFTFERSANCDAVAHSNSGGLFKDAHTINFQDINGANSDSDTEVTLSSYPLLAASLNISAIPTVNANVGDTYTRDITLAQGGNGCTEKFTYYVDIGEDVDDVYELYYLESPSNPILLTPESKVGQIWTYIIDLNAAFLNTTLNPVFNGNVGNGDNCFDNGEVIIFQESFRVDDCLDTAIVHNTYWGCSPGETCQAAESQTGSVNFGANVPEIAITKIGTTTPDLCQAVTYTVQIENTKLTAGSMALDVGINLGLGANTTPISTAASNTLWDFDYHGTRSVSNFRFGTNPTFNPDNRASTSFPTRGSGNTISIPPNFFSSDPDGPGGFDDLDNDGFYDDLPPGASTQLSFDFAIAPKDNCGTGTYNYMEWEHTYFDAYFKDQCKSDRLPERIDLNYFNIIRDYRSVTEVEAPTDIVNNEDFVIRIAPSIQANGNGTPLIGGQPLFSTGNNSTWSVTITVPTGMALQGSVPTGFTQSGNQITYTTTDISGPEYKEWVEFPLTFTCGPNGVQAIPYTTNYTATSGGNVCWSQDIHCGTINIYTHCPGGCVGPAIEGFTARRLTAGWTDDTMTTKVILDDNTDGIKKYLAGDQMKITTTASINSISLDNLYFDLTYDTFSAAAGGSGIITLVDSKITINDNSAGTSDSRAITTAPVLTTNGTTEHMLSFDLSDERDVISAAYLYEGDATNRDIVEVELTFEFSKDFKDIDYFELTNLRGEFFAFTDYPSNTALNRVGCDTWGDRAYYSRPRIYGSNQTRATSGCTPSNGWLYFQHNMAPSDMHTDEYRPLTNWTSTVVDIPEGARFTGNVTSAQFQGAYSTTSTDFIATESNGQVIITPGPNFKNKDQTALTQPRFYVEFIGTCESPASARYDYTINYNDFAYATPISSSFTNTNTFNYTQPTFIIQSPLPTVNGDAYTVYFDTNISNTSPDAVDYNWLQVTSPVGINITSAFSVNAGAETPVNFYQSGDKTWIEAGSVASGATKSIRFKADFDDCQDLTVLVEHGWDCSGYPGYPNTSIDTSDFQGVGATCYQNSTSITLEPKGSQVQVAITNQPSMSQDLCTPFDIGVDVISAQLADLINPSLQFAIPGGAGGITIVTTNVTYPKGSTIATDTQAVTVTIENGIAKVNLLEHTGILALNGIKGNPAVNSINERTAHVDFEIQLECEFVSNSKFTFKVYGEEPCGDIAAGNGSRIVSNAIQANGAVTPYNAISNIYLPGSPIQGCGVTDNINVVTTITDGTTGSSDFGKIILRSGIEYVDATFASADGATFNSIATVGDHQELILNYPPGISGGSTITFNFDFITTNDGICDDEAEVQIVNYVSVTGVTCATPSSTTNCPDFQVATGSSYEIMPLEKPILVGTANESFFSVDTSNNYEYHLALDIENTALVDADAGYAYSVYCADVNGDIDGAAIATGTIADAIPNSSTITDEIIFTTAGAACTGTNFIVEFLPSSTNCQCEAILIPVSVASGAPLDLDDDNDGIPDVIEVYNGDADGDGTLDYEDPDFCAATFDGINGWDCATMGLPDPDDDLDGDGTPNYYDTDFPTCGGLNANGICINFDTDGDGVPNQLDLDSDNDGITDLVEAGSGNIDADGDGAIDIITDIDNDGLADVVDNDTTDGPEGSAPCTPQNGCVQVNSTSNVFDTDGDGTTDDSGDFDGDGILNAYDLDSDNDGILDTVEAQTTSGFIAPGAIDPLTGIPAVGSDTDGIDPIDTDGDGNPDYLDLDADNDGITDTLEAGGEDIDGDGAIDGFVDADGNGVADSVDTTPLPDEDSDNDGILDRLDLDSDNDGITDTTEAGGMDGDGDGIIDTFMTDTDNDGLADSVDPVGPATPGTPIPNPDTDNDGLDDRIDLDSENDGIPDVIEAGGSDPDNDGRIGAGPIDDTDGDGLSDLVDPDDNTTTDLADGTGTPLPIDNFDSDSVPNHLDIDSDNDGITDTTEAGGLDVNGDGLVDGFDDTATTDGWDDATALSPLPIPNTDGTGGVNYLDIDADDDGIPDNVEAQTTAGYIAPADAEAANGLDTNYPVGLTPVSTDGDLIPDYLDSDSDNDGIDDVVEAGQDTITDPLADADADGLNDAFDDTPGNDVNNDLDTGAIATDNVDDLDTAEVDFRSILDSDNDGIMDTVDIDDDNDGILDSVECASVNPSGKTVTPYANLLQIFSFTPTVTLNGNSTTSSLTTPFGTVIATITHSGNPIESINTSAVRPAGTFLDIKSNPNDDGFRGVNSGGSYTLTYDFDKPIDVFFFDAEASVSGENYSTSTNGNAFEIIDSKNINFATITGLGTKNINVAANNTTIADAPVILFVSKNTTQITFNISQLPGGKTGMGVGLFSSLCIDTDGDGIPDSIDLDSDNDGIPDSIEAGGTDTDGDGHIDYPIAGDPTSMTDINNDGLADEIADTPLPDEDSDGDGIEDRIDLDSDNDGIPDVTEAGGPDADNDGVIDTFATDTDRDGLADSVDPADATTPGTPLESPDTDDDGFDDRIDTDSDNDGIPDVTEAGGSDPDNDGVIGTGTIDDADGDGLSDIVDTDDNTSPTATDGPGTALPIDNFDGDANPNHLDIDADNDGVLDLVENGTGPLDTNNDGAIDSTDDVFLDANDNGQADATEGTAPLNTDTTGGANYVDIDADDDGIPDNVEAQTTAAYDAPDDAFDAEGLDTQYPGGITPADTDNDLIPDYLDPDSDDDGTPDVIEAGQGTLTDPLADADGDGLNDAFDDTPGTDVNNDLDTGAIATDNEDDLDTAEVDFRSILDRDQDGIMDIVDLDDDNDGISDLDEANGVDPSADDDGDGIVNYLDDAPADPLVGDVNGIVEPAFDFDGDGIPNHFDIDADNDGIFDVYEAGNDALDTNNDGVIDGVDDNFEDNDNDGQADSSETTSPINTDTTGNADFLDIDADDDGIPDNVEAQPTTGYVVPADAFDFNGVDTNYPNGLRPEYTDTDLTPDYLDTDSDDDGTPDAVEAGQGAITDPLADADGDGLNDAFDDTPGNDVNNDLDTGAIATDNVDDVDTAEVDFRSILDFDQDGIMDIVDLDDDNDGISDVDEANGVDPSADDDGDGIVNYLDDDPADPLVGDVNGTTEPAFDFDGDGIPNHFDIDADNDGIYDVYEAGNDALDTNNDGVIDGLDTGFEDNDNDGQADSSETTSPINTDMTGNADFLDIDADDDGIPDNVEAQPTTGYVVPANTFDVNGVDTNYPNGLRPEDTDTDLTPDYLDDDSDNDGISDMLEAGQGTLVDPLADADADGLNDAFDDTLGTDVNNDLDTGAIATDNEDDTDVAEVDFRSVLDFDQDGIPDTVDLDDDNDGISDLDEANGIDPSADDDNDGVPNHSDDDPADPLVGDVNGTTEPAFDFDGDGIPNHFDIDADNDGIYDVYEAGNDALDTNNDGVIDGLDTGFEDNDNDGQADSSETTSPINTDTTGNADFLDIDADDDGIPDNVEAQPTTGYVVPANTFDVNGVDTNYPNGLRPEDTDTDLTPDYLDDDSDNDGISDVLEAGQGTLVDPLADADADGLNDAFDDTLGNDVNNDLDTGAIATDNEDDTDVAEVDFRSVLDFDGDGIPDTVDLDDDNDGISDLDEANGIDPSADDDNDGVPNHSDDDPADPLVGDVNGTTEPAFDFDGDGIPNHFDIDADNDGIVDVVEAGNGDLDTNNDGVIDGLDTGFADIDDNGQADDAEGTTPPNTDGTGEANFLDIDADDDGIPDNVEAQPTDTYTVPADAFDATGLDTNYPGGIEPEDTDMDGIPDYIDTDSDADGLSDALEAGQGTMTDPLADADGDGLNDAYDDTPGNDVNNDLNTGAIATDNEDDADLTQVDFRDILDFDKDGIPDYIDLDDDNDGISDVDEANGIDPSADDDNDGVPNHSDDDPNDPFVGDINGTTEPAFDFDGDGIPNHFDIDADNDGIYDVYEAGNDALDTNNDGVIDGLDTGFEDNDNDGQADSSETTSPINTDTTGNADFLDIDADDDGIPDNVEAQTTAGYIVPANTFDVNGVDTNYPNGLRPEDTDTDLIPDYLDLDSEDDGISDMLEAGQGTLTDPLADADGDGLNDAFDDTIGIDVNNDLDTGAIATDNEDDTDVAEVDFRSVLDFDQDGIPDTVDLDDDNDGISDVDEANGIDPSGDNDNDGVPNHSDDDLNDPLIGNVNGTTEPAFDFDGDGIPNHFDIDADNDGIVDVVEAGNGVLDTNNDGVIDSNDTGFADANNNGQADSSEGTTPPNTDGTGEANFLDIDADDDGIPDNVEAQPTLAYVVPADAFNASGLDTNYPGGLVPEDTDGDGTPDYLDLDSEDDGVLDIDETDEGTFTGVDSDNDGLDNGFDRTPGNDVNNDLDTGADGTDNDDDATTPEVNFREIGDSDGDGVLDTQEEADGTDKNDPCDYVIENITLDFSGDYLVADCDGDGVLNGQELDDDTNPEDPCDYDEGSITVEQGGDYLISDCDEDGITTSQELAIGTDPDVADTDGDTILDGQEITDGTDPLDPCDSIGGVPTLAAGCTPEVVDSGIAVTNEILTPDNDGINDFFRIENIESFPNNTVQIYNRWGVVVYEMAGYDNQSNVFRGISNGRVTISTDSELPVGVYFYIIKYVNEGNHLNKAGYLYINR